MILHDCHAALKDPEWQRRVRDRAWELAESGGAEGWLHNVLLLQHHRPSTSISTSAGGGRAEEVEEDQRRIERARRELAKRQTVLRPLRLGTDAGQGATSSRHQRTEVVKAKIANLEAALRALDLEEERELEADRADAAARDDELFVVRPDVATAELDQALALLRRQLHHATHALARERELRAEAQTIGEALTRQLQQHPHEATSQEEREEMIGRVKQLRECNAALREGLLAFADRIYPPPSAGASQEPITKRPRAVEEGPPPPYASLRETLAELLDAAQKREKTTKAKTTKKDADGWVEMSTDGRRLWPHYVELLLRAGIAQKHPKDSSLLHLRHYTAQ